MTTKEMGQSRAMNRRFNIRAVNIRDYERKALPNGGAHLCGHDVARFVSASTTFCGLEWQTNSIRIEPDLQSLGVPVRDEPNPATSGDAVSNGSRSYAGNCRELKRIPIVFGLRFFAIASQRFARDGLRGTVLYSPGVYECIHNGLRLQFHFRVGSACRCREPFRLYREQRDYACS